MAKIASLLLAIVLWFLINEHLTDKGGGPWFPTPPDAGERIEL